MKKVLTILFIFTLIFILTIPVSAIADPSNGQGNAYGHDNPSNPHYQGGQPGNSGGNPPPGPGGNPGHGTTNNVTNNYYNTANTEYSGTYNDMDIEQTFNYDVDNDYTYDYSQTNNEYNNAYAYAYSSSYTHSPVTNNYIDNSEVLQAISSMQDSYSQTYFSDITQSTLDINLTDNYSGTVSGPPSSVIPDDMDLSIGAKVSLNPAKLPLQLSAGEFAKFVIAVTADKPIRLNVTGSKGNVKVLVKEVVIGEPYGVAYVPVIYTFRKGDYWSYGKVLFTNIYGDIMATTSITCDNIYALDWSSSLTTGPRYTDITHGFKVNRGSYGLAAAIGVKHDREENDSMVYGTVKVDW